MAYWSKGDRVVLRLGDRRQAAGTIIEVSNGTGQAASKIGKVLGRRASTGERLKVRWDDGREGHYAAGDLDRA